MLLNLHNKRFDEEMLQSVISAVNTESANITVYLSSPGGSQSVMEAMLDIVDNDARIEVVGYDSLQSSAFEFFVKAKCRKRLLPKTLGMIHQVCFTVDLDERKKPYYEIDKAALDMLELQKKDSQEFLRLLGLTHREEVNYNLNKNVYFHYDRFLEVVENYKRNTALNE